MLIQCWNINSTHDDYLELPREQTKWINYARAVEERCYKIAPLKIDGVTCSGDHRPRRQFRKRHADVGKNCGRFPLARQESVDGHDVERDERATSPFRRFKRDDKYFSRVFVHALQRLNHSKRANGGQGSRVTVACAVCRVRANAAPYSHLTYSRHIRLAQDLREICAGFALYPSVTPRETKSEPSRCAARQKPPFLSVWDGHRRGPIASANAASRVRRTFESDQSSCARARALSQDWQEVEVEKSYKLLYF